jgi:hypothetical protein
MSGFVLAYSIDSSFNWLFLRFISCPLPVEETKLHYFWNVSIEEDKKILQYRKVRADGAATLPIHELIHTKSGIAVVEALV